MTQNFKHFHDLVRPLKAETFASNDLLNLDEIRRSMFPSKGKNVKKPLF